jgi:hypothetical protein
MMSKLEVELREEIETLKTESLNNKLESAPCDRSQIETLIRMNEDMKVQLRDYKLFKDSLESMNKLVKRRF